MQILSLATLLWLASVTNGQSTGDFGLDPNVPPSENFDLRRWHVGVPVPNDYNGFSTLIYENELNAGYESEYFYTGADGAMVFWINGTGVTTSLNTKYMRSEMGSMLRAGDYSIGIKDHGNNWAFSSVPQEHWWKYGGIDGELTATLAINHVMTTGTDPNWQGRIIIGQIHALNNEPCRLYYQKLPNNTRGGLYFGHELSVNEGGADIYYNVLGNMSPTYPGDFLGEVQDASDPEDGIALDEIFSYSIKAVGQTLTVSVYWLNGTLRAQQIVDMEQSGYDDPANSMHFKAGLYLQDNTFADDDWAQVSFYALKETYDTSHYRRDYGLDPEAPPSTNFDLSTWKLTEPTADPVDGWAFEIEERELVGWESEYFYTGDDGAMVFYSNGEGKKTSNNTMYIRSELREMLRAGDYDYGCCEPGNNWIFSTIPEEYYSKFRGVNGKMSATVSVDHVMTTGTDPNWQGRIIIGQIHSRNNEPIRLYYQKLPNNTKGALYFGHEYSTAAGGHDFYYNLLGNMAEENPEDFLGEVKDASNPENGIALGEKFRYTIIAEGKDLTCTIETENRVQLASITVDMTAANYTDPTSYMYFKAGLYLQDNTFELDDYAQVSFYELVTEHDTSYYPPYGLDPNVPPSENFDLTRWHVGVPIPNDYNGFSTLIYENELTAGYESEYFYTGADGAMVFWINGTGVTTSLNTKYMRSELGSMLRAGDYSIGIKEHANNWAFSSISPANYSVFGGIDGELTATLAINHVMTTGTDPNWQGRIIIGQIHALNNEPCRLYYQKLPNNTRGGLYFGHELSVNEGGADIYYNLLGNMSPTYPGDFLGEVQDESDPEDGIALDEIFSYSIKAVGQTLTVTVFFQNGTMRAQQIVDMEQSGYDDPNNSMHFKAGLYLQDNTFADDDWAQVSFYALKQVYDTSYYDPSVPAPVAAPTAAPAAAPDTTPVSSPLEDAGASYTVLLSYAALVGTLFFTLF